MDVKSATRVLDIFEAYADARVPLSPSQMADRLRIPMTSCFNLMRTIESRGYLYALQARGGRYPTRRLLEIAQVISGSDPIGATVTAILGRLREDTGETVCLAKRNDLGVLYTEAFESPQRIRYIVRPGETRTLHANSIGKAILATLAPAELDATLDRIEYRKFTEATIVAKDDLRGDINKGRQRGWWSNDGETEPDALAVAIPVRIGSEWYGVSVVGPRYRMKPRLRSLIEQLRAAGAEVSAVESTKGGTAGAGDADLRSEQNRRKEA
jgi:DNA-binding IclR family transcriptional regulator